MLVVLVIEHSVLENDYAKTLCAYCFYGFSLKRVFGKLTNKQIIGYVDFTLNVIVWTNTDTWSRCERLLIASV